MRLPAADPGVARRSPGRPADPARPDRRGAVRAALALIAVVSSLLLIPLALPAGLILTVLTLVTRWRRRWLVLPALAGAAWLAAASRGGGPVITAAWGTRAAAALHAARLDHPAAAAATLQRVLPGELPAALVLGALLAALAFPARARRQVAAGPRPAARSGLPVAPLRRWRSAAVLAAGQTVTATGAAIGLDTATGKLTALSWDTAGQGILLAGSGQATAPVTTALVCAALRRRKTVLVADAGRGDGCTAAGWLAAGLGVPARQVLPGDGALAAAAGRAVRTREVVLTAGAQALGELDGMLRQLAARGLAADCLLWVSGCGPAGADQVASLLELGPDTGTAVLVTAGSPAGAAALAGLAGTTIVCGAVSRDLSAVLAAGQPGADALARQDPGEFTVIGPGAITGGQRAVPVTALAQPRPVPAPGAWPVLAAAR